MLFIYMKVISLSIITSLILVVFAIAVLHDFSSEESMLLPSVEDQHPQEDHTKSTSRMLLNLPSNVYKLLWNKIICQHYLSFYCIYFVLYSIAVTILPLSNEIIRNQSSTIFPTAYVEANGTLCICVLKDFLKTK